MVVRRRPEVYVFVLWSEARTQEEAILADLARRFTVLDLVEVTWTRGQVFADNLSRMYGDTLSAGSEKELHSGSGPFLLVVVQDRRPRYGVRRTSRGRKWMNRSVFDARRLYRSWTGGGWRVHASDSTVETERNLVLLLGMRTDEVLRNGSGDGTARRRAGDPVGTHGWRSWEELELALSTYSGRVARGLGTSELTVATDDLWWSERATGGVLADDGTRAVTVAGRPVRITFVEEEAAPPRSPVTLDVAAQLVVDGTSRLIARSGPLRALVRRAASRSRSLLQRP